MYTQTEDEIDWMINIEEIYILTSVEKYLSQL